MTQADLAGDDFTKSFISQIEKNQARPSLRSLQIFAQRLNRPVSFFLDEGSDTPQTSSEALRALSTGDLLEREGRYEEALQLYDSAVKQCGSSDYRCRGQVYRQRARALLKLDQLQAALQALTLSSEEFRLAKDSEARASVDRYLGEVYTRLRMPKEAIHHYERALLLFEEVLAPHPDAESAFASIQLLTDLGLLVAAQTESDRALGYLRRAESLARDFNVFYRWGEASLAMSELFVAQGDLPQAAEYARQATSGCEIALDHDGLIAAVVQLGAVRFKDGGKRAAEQYFDEAMDIARRANSAEGMSRVREALASMALAEGDSERALSLYKEAIEGTREDERALNIHKTLAELFRTLEQWDDAATHLESIATQLEKGNCPRALLETYSTLAEVYEAGGHPEDAARCLQRSMEIYKQTSM